MIRISPTRPIRSALREYESRVMADAERRCRIVDTRVALRERSAPGIAPIEPADLIAQFVSEPEAAYLSLADLTDEQMVNQAIETAVYLEGMGKDVPWALLLERWQQRIDVLLVAMAWVA